MSDAAERIGDWLAALAALPGLSGHEDRVRRRIAAELDRLGIATRTDPLGNLVAHLPGDGPRVMLIAHMDQLGFHVRRITDDGFLMVERVGGVPERALAAQEMLVCVGEGRDLPAVIANKSHHATRPDEKYRVVPYAEITLDAGFSTAKEAAAAGIRIGTPVVYGPRTVRLAGTRVAGAAIDDRAACATMLEIARAVQSAAPAPDLHLAFSVQEEFNLRGVLPAAREIAPAVSIQLDLALAADTPEMAGWGDVRLGGGPAICLQSFHGRGTLNGLIPHPALVGIFERAASDAGMAFQRTVHTGALTETSYVQHLGAGVACVDLGFPCRYTHSAREVCDLADLEGLASLVLAGLSAIAAGADLDRDAWT